MMESIEKLRETVEVYAAQCDVGWMLDGISEIEAEIGRDYMKLPVDADGAPIHVGDVMCSAGIREKGHKVIASAIFEDGFVEYGSENGFIGPLHQEDWVHAKPRTLEDVLKAFFHDALDADTFCTVRLDDVLAKYADEIHALLGGDAS